LIARNIQYLPHFVLATSVLNNKPLLSHHNCCNTVNIDARNLTNFVLNSVAAGKTQSVRIPAQVVYEMAVSCFIRTGTPLSVLETEEMEAVFGHFIGVPPNAETLYDKFAFRIESTILEDVRFRFCVSKII